MLIALAVLILFLLLGPFLLNALQISETALRIAGGIILFLIVELLLDYIFQLDFRNVRWMLITYVTLFFAATGGMIGIASNGGKLWTIISVILFFIQ